MDETETKNENGEQVSESSISETMAEESTSAENQITEKSIEEKTPEEKLQEEKLPEEKKKPAKKKKNIFLRIFLGLIYFILIVVLLVAGWLGVNYFIKADIVDSVPSDYSVHLRTDSVWDSVNPLLDLKATDIILNEAGFSKYNELLVDFRKSSLRKNTGVDLVLSRRLDFMLYENNSFVVVLDTGFLAGIAKLAPYALKYISIKNLSVIESPEGIHLEYKNGESVYYVIIRKNLVIVSSSEDLFEKTLNAGFASEYSVQKKQSFEDKLSVPFAVTADSIKVLEMVVQDNPYLDYISGALNKEEPATIDFGITDKNLNLSLKIPYDLEVMKTENPVTSLLLRESKIPVTIQKLPESVQYYTTISACSLEEMKNAFFFASLDSNGWEDKWKTGEKLSKTVFRTSIEDLIFSWTDDEFSVFGLEQKPDPVIAIKVKDEEKRRKVFDTLFASIILQSDTSLIMDNVRLPRIEIPDFFQGILELFGIRLPSPYYMVKDGFVYFSQSPENLAAINAAIKNGTRLTQNETWQETSKNDSQNSSVSLYYNLERSIPFFLKKKTSVSKILELYNVGRLNLKLSGDHAEISLGAVESKNTSSLVLSGFPISLEEPVTTSLVASSIKGSRVIFYGQKDKIVSYNLATQERFERKIENLKFITGAYGEQKGTGGTLWAVTADGTVYYLTEKLKDPSGFPLVIGQIPSSAGTASKDGLLYNAKGQTLVTVSENGKWSGIDVDSFDDITSAPVPGKNFTLLYEKSFLGGIHVIKDSKDFDLIDVEGMAFGQPDYIKQKNSGAVKGSVKIGFVLQSGKMLLIDYVTEGDMVGSYDFDIEELDGVFYLNAKACGNSFVALSEDGTLYAVDVTKNIYERVTKVKIPHMTARSGFITVVDFDHDGSDEVFVCGDGNIIYGFRENLELIGSFPVSGYGVPLFFDLDGNKFNECVCLSLDNKINGWKINY